MRHLFVKAEGVAYLHGACGVPCEVKAKCPLCGALLLHDGRVTNPETDVAGSAVVSRWEPYSEQVSES